MIPSLPGLLQAISLFVVAILLARPLGGYMEAAMEGKRVFLSPIIRPVERSVYWILRVDEKVEQNWRAYAVSVIVFSFVCIDRKSARLNSSYRRLSRMPSSA